MNVKNLVLGIGIVVVYALMLWQGIEAFYPSPQYENFCQGREGYYYGVSVGKTPLGAEVNCTVNPTPQQQNQCSTNGGNLIVDKYDTNGCASSYTCDYCNKEFQDSQKDYSKIVFVIGLIIGIITLIIGYSILSREPVGSALIASGIWAIFYGSAWNWRNFSNIWRFLLLLVALVVLIWITLKLNENKGFLGFGKKK